MIYHWIQNEQIHYSNLLNEMVGTLETFEKLAPCDCSASYCVICDFFKLIFVLIKEFNFNEYNHKIISSGLAVENCEPSVLVILNN